MGPGRSSARDRPKSPRTQGKSRVLRGACRRHAEAAPCSSRPAPASLLTPHLPGTCSRHHRPPAVPSSWVSLPRHLHACCLAASGVYPNAGLPVRFPAPRSLLRDPPWRRARTCGVSTYCFHVPAASPGAAPLQAADYTALFPTPARRRISSLKPATAGRC